MSCVSQPTQTEPISATFGGFYSSLELQELNSFTYPGSTEAIAFNGDARLRP